MSEKYGEPLTLHIQDGLQKVYPNKRKGPYYFAVATIETSLPSGAYRWNPETNNHDISVGQEIADKAFDDRNEVWSKEVIERMERVVLTYNACANRSESEIKAAFALLDNREKVVGILGDIKTLLTQSQPSSPREGRVYDGITAALALLNEGGGE